MILDRTTRVLHSECWSRPWRAVERTIVAEGSDDFPRVITLVRLSPAEMRRAAMLGHVEIPQSELPARRQS